MQNCYSFSVFNKYSQNGICQALNEYFPNKIKPVLICVGSDLVLGDSLGPLVGTLLKEKGVDAYIYGTLNTPVTAKEISTAKTQITKTHPNSITVAIDAAVGDPADVGIIRVVNQGLKPGLGVNKNLDTLGNVSIIGVVASRSDNNYNLFNLTHLNLVYTMANKIANAITDFISLSTYDDYGTNLGCI